MIKLADEGFIDEHDDDAVGSPHTSAVDRSPWVDELPLHEREELVYKLLSSMPRARIARVHRRIAPFVQVDIVGTLPSELALLVFSHLSWQTLLKCALVNKRWRALADDPTLWKQLCHLRQWEWKRPTLSRSPSPFVDEDFDDEGMGDDEEVDDAHWQSVAYADQDSGFASHVPQASGPVSSLEVVGLPSTPRLGQHSRATSVKAKRRRSPSRPRFLYRRSAPSILPSAEPPKPDYKLLHQTHILLHNRLLHGAFRFSTLQTRGTANSHTSIIYCLQLYTYEDGRQVLFTGSKDRTIREWDISTGNVDRVFEGAHAGSVLSLCAHGNYIASGGSDCRVCVWDIRTGALVRKINDHADSVLCVRFNEKHLVSCSKDRTVRMYLFPNLDSHRILGTHRAAVNAVALSGDMVVSASGDKSMRLWDARTGEQLRTFEGHHTRGIASIDFQSPYILSGSSDKHLRCFNIQTRRGWSTCAQFHLPSPASASSICDACGTSFGEGDENERRGVPPPSRRASVAAQDTHSDLVRSVALGSDFVLSGSYDESVKVWDRETGSLVADLSGRHEGRVFCVGFDCTKIVSCGEDQKICIWDLSHGIDTSFLKL